MTNNFEQLVGLFSRIGTDIRLKSQLLRDPQAVASEVGIRLTESRFAAIAKFRCRIQDRTNEFEAPNNFELPTFFVIPSLKINALPSRALLQRESRPSVDVEGGDSCS